MAVPVSAEELLSCSMQEL